jgi:methyl-accepting chemotaxis protein
MQWRLSGPVRRVVAVAAIMITLVGTTLAIMIWRYEAALSRVGPLGAAASSARSQALAAGIAALIVTFAGGILAGRDIAKLVGRGLSREDDLAATLRRLSDRDELLAKLRSAAGVLREHVTELHDAAEAAAVASSQQSSAVTETSATIAELAATAGTIADNARAGATGAERAGDTMRDMQDKVEAIAVRTLSLGKRTQQIGSILELINELAAQTTLLALNAAIEAARAGEAGRGFAIVAVEVRKLAERSMQSTDSIREIITAVQDETNSTIVATEQGTHQARDVAELMTSTAAILEESILVTQQQKSAADQAETAMGQIREAADRLTASQQQRATSAGRLAELVSDLDAALFSGSPERAR